MVKIAVADNYPVVHFGLNSFFKDNTAIKIVANLYQLIDVYDYLKTNPVDVLLIDLNLTGLDSVLELKNCIKEFPATKILIYSDYSEKMFAPNSIKVGALGYVHKSDKLEFLSNAIQRVNHGETVLKESIRRSLTILNNTPKSERSHRKLSTRELEVLRYLSDGKKNAEIAVLLGLNEKTVSTYKMRLQIKLNVTNLLDLVNKAKTLETY